MHWAPTAGRIKAAPRPETTGAEFGRAPVTDSEAELADLLRSVGSERAARALQAFARGEPPPLSLRGEARRQRGAQLAGLGFLLFGKIACVVKRRAGPRIEELLMILSPIPTVRISLGTLQQ
jgi:hypothetical protein